MRHTLANLVRIAVSSSPCGQVPVSIQSQNIQLTVANGNITTFLFSFVDTKNITVFYHDSLSVIGTTDASMILPSDVFATQPSVPECIRTEMVTQNPAIYNISQEDSSPNPNITIRYYILSFGCKIVIYNNTLTLYLGHYLQFSDLPLARLQPLNRTNIKSLI